MIVKDYDNRFILKFTFRILELNRLTVFCILCVRLSECVFAHGSLVKLSSGSTECLSSLIPPVGITALVLR